jgi:hypothetical protein
MGLHATLIDPNDLFDADPVRRLRRRHGLLLGRE